MSDGDLERLHWATDLAIHHQRVVKDGDRHIVPDLLVAQATDEGGTVDGGVIIRRDDGRWALLVESLVERSS